MFSAGAGEARPKRKDTRKGDGGVVQKDWGMYDEIIEMLLAAGYFRVRIAGLSEFDKVIGGLCWCITNSLEALDVDIFFQENPSIGQKIKISESVANALIKMECFWSLEPHQIQGEDFKAIYPVIQWLVKKVMAVRQASKARLFSEALFDKAHRHPQDIEKQALLENQALPFLWKLKSNYAKPTRKFRRTEKMDFASELAHVQYVLLEYGEQHGGGSDGARGAGQEGTPGEAGGLDSLKQALAGKLDDDQDRDEEEEDEEAEEDLVDDEMKAKLAGAKGASKVSSKEVGGLVVEGSDAIRQAANDFTMSAEEAEALQAKLAGGLAESLLRQIQSLQKQVEQQEQRHEQLKSIDDELKNDVKEMLNELKRRGEENDKMTDELAQMEAMKTSENKLDLERLRSLVLLNENFKQQEQRFKDGCKAQRNTLVAKINGIGEDNGEDGEDAARVRQIEEVYLKDLDKFTRVRQMLAKKNQEVAFVQRRIEEVPTRTELTQYERRFVELYEQVAAKLDETRKYFDTFNNLQERRGFYGSELDLMNRVYEQYAQVASNKAQKESYVQKMAGIKSEIEGSVDKIKQTLATKCQERDALHDHYSSLQEKQRAYYKACREFQVECDKNEYLLSLEQGQAAK